MLEKVSNNFFFMVAYNHGGYSFSFSTSFLVVFGDFLGDSFSTSFLLIKKTASTLYNYS